MANLNITIAAKDESSGVLSHITGSVDGLGKKLASVGGISLSGIVGSLGALGLASFGVNAVGSALQGFLGDAIDAEKVQNSLNAVLKSTHGVSGMTADSVNALADSLSKVTPFEDEAIGSAENMLLTFTGIGKKVFPEATEAVLNMSQALGQDLQSSSIQLGKALNDPIAGVTALQRVGVKLTDTQKALVEHLVKTGDVVGAQKVILAELSTEFGGAAKAAGETFAGKKTILNTQIGNVKEAIGGPLIGVISGLVTAVLPAVEAFANGLPDGIAAVQASLTTMLAPAAEFATQAFHSLKDAFGIFMILIGDVVGQGGDLGVLHDDLLELGTGIDISGLVFFTRAVADFVPHLLQFSSGVVAAVQGLVGGGGIEQMLADLNDYFVEAFDISPGEVVAKLQILGAGVLGWITAQASLLPAQLREWGRAFTDWVNPIIADVLARLDFLRGSIQGWITAQASLFPAQFREWERAFVEWVTPATEMLLAEWNDALNRFLDWIEVASGPIVAQLSAWATAFVAWIVPATTQFLAQWPGMLNQFLDWIEVSAGPILFQLGQWAVSFVSWIVPMIPGFLMALAGISIAILAFIGETLITIGLRLLKWGLAFVEWIVPQIPGFITELGKLADALFQWIADQAVLLAPKALDLGVTIVKSLIQGLMSVQLPSLNSLVTGAANVVSPPPAASFGPSSGGVTNNSATGPTVNVHIYGDNANPVDVGNQSKQGVMAASRALGYS